MFATVSPSLRLQQGEHASSSVRAGDGGNAVGGRVSVDVYEILKWLPRGLVLWLVRRAFAG